ncbi:nicastrin [Lycorma delicatula]|uniref:nicastrin n=1 Tax=Lycorma delicatula TaxID=130591 RepID=UPI003F519B82
MNTSCLFFILISITVSIYTVMCDRQDIHHMLYEYFPNAVSCFRLLNGTHQFGCSSDTSGSLGVIHVINSENDVNWLSSSDAVAGPYMAVVSPQIFSSEEIMTKLRKSSVVSGILLAMNGTLDRPEYLSPDDTCPNRYSALSGTCDVKWNPHGTSYILQDWGKPMFFINDGSVISKINECFLKFNKPLDKSQLDKNLCSLQMKGHMYAAVDTPTCIRRSQSLNYFSPLIFCDPMGDRNIVSSLFPLQKVTTGSLIIITTHLDVATMFDNLAPAAMSTITGIVTLMATHHLLSKMFNTTNNADYSKNVMFIMFSGEAYDYIGSSRVVYDIKKNKFPSKSKAINLDDIGAMFELNQLDKSREIYLHYNGSNTVKDYSLLSEFNSTFSRFAKDSKFGINYVNSANSLLPSSVQSFLKEVPNFPYSVLANFGKQYKNRYYSSMLDNSTNIDYTFYDGSNNIPDDSVQAVLTDLATVLAKSLYYVITKNDYKGPDYLKSTFVDNLMHCYLDTTHCELFKEAFPYEPRTPYEPNSVYVGVARSENVIVTFTQSSLAFLTGNKTDLSFLSCTEAKADEGEYEYIFIAGKSGSGECYKSNSRFTTAVSPAFEIADYDWSSGKYSSWTESVWQDLNLRMFLKPSRQQEIQTFLVGLFVLLLSFFTVYWIKSRASFLFHTKPGVIC